MSNMVIDQDSLVKENTLVGLSKVFTAMLQYLELFDEPGAVAVDALIDIMDRTREGNLLPHETFHAVQTVYLNQCFKLPNPSLFFLPFSVMEEPQRCVPVDELDDFKDAIRNARSLTHRVVNASTRFTEAYQEFRLIAEPFERSMDHQITHLGSGEARQLAFERHKNRGLRPYRDEE